MSISDNQICLTHIYYKIEANENIHNWKDRQSNNISSEWYFFFGHDVYPESGENGSPRKNLVMSRVAQLGPEIITYTVRNEFGSTCTGRLTYYPRCEVWSSPLAIDLDGDNQITRINQETLFDLDADGTKETLTQWFSANDGILIRMPQAGEAFSGEHLFGDQGGQYLNGFQKLARLDSNADGQVNGAELNDLAIWQDKNTNAQLDLGEIISLEQAQISSLGTQHDNYIGSATNTDGAHIHFEDVWFNSPIK